MENHCSKRWLWWFCSYQSLTQVTWAQKALRGARSKLAGLRGDRMKNTCGAEGTVPFSFSLLFYLITLSLFYLKKSHCYSFYWNTFLGELTVMKKSTQLPLRALTNLDSCIFGNNCRPDFVYEFQYPCLHQKVWGLKTALHELLNVFAVFGTVYLWLGLFPTLRLYYLILQI